VGVIRERRKEDSKKLGMKRKVFNESHGTPRIVRDYCGTNIHQQVRKC
jgi:hypothetical protein